MANEKYTVTVYAAAPGTPLYENGVPKIDKNGKPETSAPGHMYYVISDGVHRNSYGFAPIEHGSIQGAGRVTYRDEQNYQNPLYARTMEITKEQHGKLKEFGDAPEKFGFDKFYKDARNNCVDFAWAGLNHAGMQQQAPPPMPFSGHHDKGLNGKGALRPSQNVDAIKGIEAPIPNSPLNKEQAHPMPDMSWWQRPLSENSTARPDQFGQQEAPAVAHGGAANDDPFEKLFQASLAADDKAFSATAQAYLQSADGQAFLRSGRDMNDQLATQKAQEMALNIQPAAPQLSVRM